MYGLYARQASAQGGVETEPIECIVLKALADPCIQVGAREQIAHLVEAVVVAQDVAVALTLQRGAHAVEFAGGLVIGPHRGDVVALPVLRHAPLRVHREHFEAYELRVTCDTAPFDFAQEAGAGVGVARAVAGGPSLARHAASVGFVGLADCGQACRTVQRGLCPVRAPLRIVAMQPSVAVVGGGFAQLADTQATSGGICLCVKVPTADQVGLIALNHAPQAVVRHSGRLPQAVLLPDKLAVYVVGIVPTPHGGVFHAGLLASLGVGDSGNQASCRGLQQLPQGIVNIEDFTTQVVHQLGYVATRVLVRGFDLTQGIGHRAHKAAVGHLCHSAAPAAIRTGFREWSTDGVVGQGRPVRVTPAQAIDDGLLFDLAQCVVVRVLDHILAVEVFGLRADRPVEGIVELKLEWFQLRAVGSVHGFADVPHQGMGSNRGGAQGIARLTDHLAQLVVPN